MERMFEYDAANIETFFRKFQIFLLQTSEVMISYGLQNSGFSTGNNATVFGTTIELLCAI
ncbi:MAG: hypothetical protein AB7S50_11755 [Bacteroidales bacterium]